MFYDVGEVVGLSVDVLWVVVWLSVRTVGTVCKVEGDFQVVNNFHVCRETNDHYCKPRQN